MKLFPSLTLALLCAAFAGCTATTQTISFVPDSADQEGVSVSVDGKELGVVPVRYTVRRTTTPRIHAVVFSKDGYQSEEMRIESWVDRDGLCSFANGYSVPNLIPAAESAAPAAVVVAAEEVVPAFEPAPAPEPAPASAPEPAPEPAAAPVPETPAEPAAPALDPTRTLKDIERDIASLSQQRQNGSLSERDFQKACAELEREIRERYGK